MAPSLICSFVMKRTVILAECSNRQDQEDVARRAVDWLETLNRSMKRITYERGDGYIFNYLIDSGYTYCVVADEAFGRAIPLAFLNQVRKDFLGKDIDLFIEVLMANTLSNELGSKLKKHMEYVAARVSKDKEVALEYLEKNRGLYLRRNSRTPLLSYSFVAYGTVVLADCLQFEDTDVNSLAVDYLPELPCSIKKITYDRDGYTINYLLDSNFTYCVVAAQAIGRKIPLAFLDQIKKDFTARFGGVAVAAVKNSLNKDFGSKLEERVRYAEAKAAEVSKDKGVAMENIEKDSDDDDDEDEDEDDHDDKEEDDDDEDDEYE